MKYLVLLLLILLIGVADAETVHVIRIDGAITEGTSIDVKEGMEEAIMENAVAILIEIDTPGGIADATLDISKEILNSKIPVITYVSPSGAIAASAGSFILISGNIAAMSPGTTVGAAMPVTIGPGGMDVADEKTIKFFAGHMKSIASKRGRNATEAEKFVTENLVLNDRNALKFDIIDLIADNREDLLKKVDGMTVKVGDENVTLHTEGAEIVLKKKTLRSEIMNILGNPQIAFILLLVGIYGIIFGFMAPGTYVPETIGAVCLILALYGMGLFDVNAFGTILIIAAILLFIAEALTPTYGVLTVAGMVCLVLGAFMFPMEPFLPVEWFNEFRLLVFGMAIASAAFFLFALGAILKSRKKKVTTGTEELIGKVVKAETDIDPEGMIKVRGEIWKARTEGEGIKMGEKVEIIGRDGLTLIVRKV
ncbi:MAG: NfeD family protein [Candidatus Syntropharchaeia archaeon]